MPAHLGMDWNNIPTMFRHLELLSTLPYKSTYDMLFMGNTIEKVTEDAASDFSAGLGYDNEFDMPLEKNVLDDPDAIDKAKYQAENPNAIMTPWGQALDPWDIENIMDTYFGADSLVGLDPEETQELLDEADAIIDNSGDALEEIISQSELTAMAENLNPNEVGTGILDEMMNIPSPESEGDDALVLDTAKDPVGGMGKAMYSPLPDPLDEAMKFLDSLLDLTDSDILFYIDEALKDWLPAESVTSWVQGYPEWSYEVSPRYNLGQGVLARVSGEDYEDWLEGPPDIETPKVKTDPLPSTPEPQYALDTASWSTLMGIEFLEALNKQPHPRYEGYTMGGLLTRKQKLDRYNEAYVVFFLDRESVEGEAPTIAKEFAAFLNKYWNNPEAYSEYMDKAKLIEKAQLLASYFDDPTGMQMGEQDVGDIYAAYAEGIFGDIYGEGPTFNDANREILLKLMRSGRSFGDHPANRYIASKLTSDKTWGKLWQVSFREMVDNMPQPVAKQPEDGTGEYFTFEGYPLDNAIMTPWGQALDPWDIESIEGAEGVSGTMLGYGPEYYGTGNPFGMPGVTLGMLRPEPVGGTDDWIITSNGQFYNPKEGAWEDYDAFKQRIAQGGMGKVMRSPNPEEIAAYKAAQVVDPTMVLPGINAAALSVSDPDPEEIAAYKAAQEAKLPWNTMPVSEKMYKEAMTQITGADVQPGATYKPSKSEVAVTGIDEDTLKSMPTPFNEEQAKRLSEGKPYLIGRWTAGTAYQWSTKSAAEKAAIIGGDKWVSGTTFVPTKQWKT